MGKLKLNLNQLAVESFDTSAVPADKGTVFGEQCTCYTQCDTCPGCPTCDNTCNQESCYTCWPCQSDYYTCGPTEGYRTCAVSGDLYECCPV